VIPAYFIPEIGTEFMMGMEFDPLTAVTATGVAGYVAIMADCMAHNLGLSNGQIRGAALVAAAAIGILLAVNRLARRGGSAV
jgi:hypothetical protein